MMQQVQAACTRCSGTGYQVPAEDRCDSCVGKGLIPEKKVFEVHIEKVAPSIPPPPPPPSCPHKLPIQSTSAQPPHIINSLPVYHATTQSAGTCQPAVFLMCHGHHWHLHTPLFGWEMGLLSSIGHTEDYWRWQPACDCGP